MIHNEADAIRDALSQIPGVDRVTRGWPKGFERLPCVAVQKAADTPVRYADDQEYIAELEYYIRIFSASAKQADTVAQAVDAVMERMGYKRTFSYDADTEQVRMDALRYRKYI